MPVFRRSSRIRINVIRAAEEGRARHAGGDLAGAIKRYQAACAMLREALAADPADQDNITQLATMSYTLGQWQMDALQPVAAIDSLDQAEAMYRRLGGEASGRVADVQIRRATVSMTFKQPLSAIADAQHALTTAVVWWAGAPDQRELDVARVAALVSHVLLGIGADPDLAVGAADRALATYMPVFLGESRFPDEHAFAFTKAAEVSAIAHAAAGRDELAQPVLRVCIAGHGGSWPGFDQEVQRIREGSPTLAQALAAAGETDLATRITGTSDGSGEFGPMVPERRCSSQVAATVASVLAGLRDPEIPEPARVLFALESHALFAAAARLKEPGMQQQFGKFGAHWARAVLDWGQLMTAREQEISPYDAVQWLAGIIRQLEPHTVTDSAARSVAVECVRWVLDGATPGTASPEAIRSLKALLKTLEG